MHQLDPGSIAPLSAITCHLGVSWSDAYNLNAYMQVDVFVSDLVGGVPNTTIAHFLGPYVAEGQANMPGTPWVTTSTLMLPFGMDFRNAVSFGPAVGRLICPVTGTTDCSQENYTVSGDQDIFYIVGRP